MGAYGHSRIRHLLIGSTTTEMLKKIERVFAAATVKVCRLDFLNLQRGLFSGVQSLKIGLLDKIEIVCSAVFLQPWKEHRRAVMIGFLFGLFSQDLDHRREIFLAQTLLKCL